MLNRILIATVLGSSLVFLDSSVANILLPQLQEDFHRGLLDLQWVVTAYGVALSALLLLGGTLGDRFGRRRIFLAGLALFSLASAACAMSSGFWELVAARSVQGVGGALLTPESLAILNATFPRDQRAKAIGTWSATSALAGVIAPPLGGWLAQIASWRAVFLINLPIAIVAGYLGWTSIPENCSETRSSRFDIRGSLLAPLGLGVLVGGMTKGFLWTVAGLGLIVLFCLSEYYATDPILPLSVFKNRMFSRINLMTFFLYAASSMVFFYLPGYLIRVEHYSTVQAGLAMAPTGMLIAALSRRVGIWMIPCGTKVFLAGGSALVALGCVALSFAPSTGNYLVSYFPGFFLIGVGFGLTVTPLTSKAMSSLSDEQSGLASGINSAVARVAGVLGVVLAAGLLTWSFREVTGQDWKKDPLMQVSANASEELRKSVEEARKSSYRELLWVSAAMSAFASLIVLSAREDVEARSDKVHRVLSSYCFHSGETNVRDVAS
jgi:EmrB/QacA subfamily drug resistance transporter